MSLKTKTGRPVRRGSGVGCRRCPGLALSCVWGLAWAVAALLCPAMMPLVHGPDISTPS